MGDPAAAGDVEGRLLSTFITEDGYTQVAYNGWPLYYYAPDQRPGDAKGQNVGDMWLTGTYREIGPVERLVKTESPADAEGEVVEMGGMPQETVVTLNLEGEGEGRTQITMIHAGLPEGDHRTHAGEGYRQTFEKLAAVLEKERERGNPS